MRGFGVGVSELATRMDAIEWPGKEQEVCSCSAYCSRHGEMLGDCEASEYFVSMFHQRKAWELRNSLRRTRRPWRLGHALVKLQGRSSKLSRSENWESCGDSKPSLGRDERTASFVADSVADLTSRGVRVKELRRLTLSKSVLTGKTWKCMWTVLIDCGVYPCFRRRSHRRLSQVSEAGGSRRSLNRSVRASGYFSSSPSSSHR